MRVKKLRYRLAHNRKGELIIVKFSLIDPDITSTDNDSYTITAEVQYSRNGSKDLVALGIKDIQFRIPESSPFFNIDLCIFNRSPWMQHIMNTQKYYELKLHTVGMMIDASNTHQ